jgi:hypothetical protein
LKRFLIGRTTQRDQGLYCRWDDYADAQDAEDMGAMRRAMVEDARERQQYTDAALELFRQEQLERQASAKSSSSSSSSSSPSAAAIDDESDFVCGDDDEEIVGYIDDDGNIIRTDDQHAVGIVTARRVDVNSLRKDYSS